MSYDFKFL